MRRAMKEQRAIVFMMDERPGSLLEHTVTVVCDVERGYFQLIVVHDAASKDEVKKHLIPALARQSATSLHGVTPDAQAVSAAWEQWTSEVKPLVEALARVETFWKEFKMEVMPPATLDRGK